MYDLVERFSNRVQLATDGHRAYLEAVEDAFGNCVDNAQLVKLYGPAPTAGRYSPPECIGTRRKQRIGSPDPEDVSTSDAERQNLTLRMSLCRFTRLTNAFSKKFDNHVHALALYFAHYNFCRIHKSLKVTPAMVAGISDRLWSMEDIVAKIDELAPTPKPRAPYGKRGAVPEA